MIFFPIVILIYFIVPHRIRWIWLLISSYYFYMSWNPKYALLLAASTFVTWGTALLLQKCRNNAVAKKWCLVGCSVFNLGILGFFKYYDFLTKTLTNLFGCVGIGLNIPTFDVILPVGISFYTFQALGYVIDVYREKDDVIVEKNLFRYALFVSFFPQLVAGPIERSGNLMSQLYEKHTFDLERMKDGLLLMGWGFVQKLVLADRIAILVTAVYSHYTNYTGMQIIVATILFAFQIYCDFAGYSDIAIGAARVMGFRLMKNFRSPYYARTVSDFWKGWHISLTGWFRDYVYIPLGGNRCSRWKHYRNLILTFSLSGLWHGASWNYVVWGGLNGLYQVIGKMTKPFRQKLQKALKIRTECWSYRFFQTILIFGLIDFTWLFFRAAGLMNALQMIRHSLTNFGPFSMLSTETMLGINPIAMDEKDFFVMLIGIAVLMIVDYFRVKLDLKQLLAKQNFLFRVLVYYGMILVILIYGIYGPEYNASAFIYFQF